MTGINPKLIALVAANIVISFAAFGLARSLTKPCTSVHGPFPRGAARRGSVLSPVVLSALRRYSDALFAIWAVGSVINISVSGGLPVFWLLMGATDRSYADYGIPTFSGLLAACGLVASLGFFLCYLGGDRKRRWWAIALVFTYQVATLSRGGTFYMLLELLGVYLQIRRFSVRRIFRDLVIIVGVILSFGVMGDFRSGGRGTEFVYATATERGSELFQHLPTGFWWIYLYGSVGVVNLNAAIDLVPLGYPYWSFLNVLPTVIRGVVYAHSPPFPIEKVSEAFNVYTLYAGYLADFGVVGCVGITFLLQLVAGHYFVKAKAGDVAAIIAYAVLFQVIVLSIFWDYFTSWVALFQLGLAFGFRHFAASRSRRFYQMERLRAIREASDTACATAVEVRI